MGLRAKRDIKQVDKTVKECMGRVINFRAVKEDLFEKVTFEPSPEGKGEVSHINSWGGNCQVQRP